MITLHKYVGRKQAQTARSEDQSLHICPCISDRQLQLQSHGPELSGKTTEDVSRVTNSYQTKVLVK